MNVYKSSNSIFVELDWYFFSIMDISGKLVTKSTEISIGDSGQYMSQSPECSISWLLLTIDL